MVKNLPEKTLQGKLKKLQGNLEKAVCILVVIAGLLVGLSSCVKLPAQQSVEPTSTAQQSVEPTSTAQHTVEPTSTAQPTAEPTSTAQPTVEPTSTAKPTAEPTSTPQPTVEPTPTPTPTPYTPSEAAQKFLEAAKLYTENITSWYMKDKIGGIQIEGTYNEDGTRKFIIGNYALVIYNAKTNEIEVYYYALEYKEIVENFLNENIKVLFSGESEYLVFIRDQYIQDADNANVRFAQDRDSSIAFLTNDNKVVLYTENTTTLGGLNPGDLVVNGKVAIYTDLAKVKKFNGIFDGRGTVFIVIELPSYKYTIECSKIKEVDDTEHITDYTDQKNS